MDLTDGRVKSFQQVPANVYRHHSARALAAAGFFHVGTEDTVCCYWCSIRLSGWCESDSPLAEHLRWSPECRYANALNEIRRKRNTTMETDGDLRYEEEEEQCLEADRLSAKLPLPPRDECGWRRPREDVVVANASPCFDKNRSRDTDFSLWTDRMRAFFSPSNEDDDIEASLLASPCLYHLKPCECVELALLGFVRNGHDVACSNCGATFDLRTHNFADIVSGHAERGIPSD